MKATHRNAHQDAEADRLVVTISTVVLVAALLDLCGWWFSIPRLTSVLPHYATMKPNTAACLGLIALGFLLAGGPQAATPLWRRLTGNIAVLLSLLLSTLTALEYLTGRSFSIDQILASVPVDLFTDPTGRMSRASAACLILTAVAFLLRDRLFGVSIASVLFVLLVSISSMLGSFFAAGPLFDVPWLETVAVHTALALLLLQIATVASRPQHEPFRSLSQQWRRQGRRRYLLFAVTLLPVLLALPVLLGWRHHLYKTPFALALLLAILMVLQTAILWSDNRALERVETRLRRSEAYSSRILQSIGDAVIVTDRNGNVTRMNSLAESLTGWAIAEAATRPLSEIFSIVNEETRQAVENPVDKVRRFGTVVGLANHTVLLRRDGSEIHIEDSSAPIPDDTGALSGIVLVFRDVEERKAAEHLIRAGDQRLQIALDTANMGTWELGIDNQLLKASSGCKANFGRAPEDPFTFADFVATVHPDDLDAVEHALRRTIETGELYRAEYRVHWPDGSLHWVVASGRSLEEIAGKPTHLVGVTLDVTERHQATLALLQSEKLAAVGRLASSIAHEINNPLEAVTNLLYLARQHADEPQTQVYLESAEQELRRVAVISSQTLRFHRQSTHPKQADPIDLLRETTDLYRSKITNARVRAEFRTRTERTLLCFDGEIRQVLGNLIGNAVDAMNPSGGRLLLRTREATDWCSRRRGIALTIADTGSGIPPQALSRIFEPFFTTKGIAGTGLGLWISKEIISRHLGSLRVRSSQRPGHCGTVFTIFLPFDAPIRPSLTPDQLAPSSPASTPQPA